MPTGFSVPNIFAVHKHGKQAHGLCPLQLSGLFPILDSPLATTPFASQFMRV